MTKLLVLYYSAWGHMEQMAYAAAEGAKEAGAKVDVKRVPELVPDEVAKAAHYKLDQKAPIAKPEAPPSWRRRNPQSRSGDRCPMRSRPARHRFPRSAE